MGKAAAFAIGVTATVVGIGVAAGIGWGLKKAGIIS